MNFTEILRAGITKGYWTLENLDKPSNGFQVCQSVDRRLFPQGYVGVEHRNLLRSEPNQERPDAGPDPRDLAPPEPFDPLDI